MFSSCSVKVWEATTTHKQVMENFKTRDKIIARFGLPTSKKVEGEYEEWMYDYGTKTITDASAVGTGYSGTNSISEATGGVVAGRTQSGNLAAIGGLLAGEKSSTAAKSLANSRTVTQNVRTYIKFTLRGDNVVTWESNNIDYGKYEYVKKSMFPQK